MRHDAQADDPRDSSRAHARKTLVLLACLCFVAVPALALAQQGGGPQTPANRVVLPPAVEQEIERELAEQAEQEKVRAERRATPEARAERQRSRSAFGELSKEQALELARQKFRAPLRAPLWDPVLLDKGERVKEIVGDHGVLVEDEKGEVVAQESLLPVRPLAGPGSAELVDLSLSEGSTSFRSENPLVGVEIPKALSDPVSFDGLGLAVAVDAGGEATTGVESSDRVFYGDAFEDLDVIAKPTPTGVEFLFQVRSSAAPERIPLAFELPKGAELRMVDDTPKQLPEAKPLGAAEVVKDGQRIALILPPRALDADGEVLSASYTLDGNRLIVDFPHRSQDALYPILVDPAIDHWDPDDGGDLYGWIYNVQSGWESFFQKLEPPAYPFMGVGMPAGTGYFTGMNAEWDFIAPRSSYITSAAYGLGAHWPTGSYPQGSCVLQGIWGPNRTPQPDFDPGLWGDQWGELIGPSPWYGGSGASHANSCAAWADITRTHVLASPSPGNVMAFRLQANGSSVRQNGGFAFLKYATIELNDNNNPQITANSLDKTGWLPEGETVTHSFGASDAGLGMDFVTHNLLDEPIATSCVNGHVTACSTALSGTASISTDQLESGIHEVGGVAADLVGWETPFSAQVKVDRGGPTITPSGTLWAAGEDTEADPDPAALNSGTSYVLNVGAADGTQGGANSERRSGVRSIQVFVDDERVDVATQACAAPSDSCPLSDSYTFNPVDFAGGVRKVQIVATDQIGNRTKTTFRVTVPATGELRYPRDGTRTSRKVKLQAENVVGGLTSVKFQYRRGFGSWTDVPLNDMATESGLPVGSQNHAITAGTSPVIVWDVPMTFALGGVDGPIKVRGLFSGGNGGFTAAESFTIDQTGLSSDDAQAPIGPGQLNLLTGNFSYQTSDVSIASFAQSLTVTRTYNSRAPATRVDPMFGPGWTSSVVVGEAASSYASLKESDPAQGDWIELLTSEGTTIFFFKTGDDYDPEPGYESLTLSKVNGQFVLKDIDGNKTTFAKETGASAFTPIEIRQPGAANTTKYTWEVASGLPRIKRALAPSTVCATLPSYPMPTGTLAEDPGPYRGCRALDFVYTSNRLTEVRLTAWNPATSALETNAVANYEYESQSPNRLQAAWDPRVSPALKETYTYDSQGRLSTATPPGENAWTLAYQQLTEDQDAGRLRSASRQTSQGTATTTAAYHVPLTAPAGPYPMGESDVAAWSQEDLPAGATAIFPPDQLPADPPTSYSRASVFYLNALGRQVNTVAPGGHTTTAEYDGFGNVVRELSASNRQRALAASGSSAAVSETLDTQRKYEDDGLEMKWELGPKHEIKLSTGEVVEARRRTEVIYDFGAPAGQSPHLPTTTTVKAEGGGATDAEARVTRTEYDWTLRQPTATIVDAASGGLQIKGQTAYISSTGLVKEARMPKSETGSDAGVSQTVYYAAATDFGEGGLSDPACTNRPEWANLPCKTKPAAQPGVAGLPDLPVTTYVYNRLQQVTETTEVVGAHQRTSTTTYDSAGRNQTESTSATGPAGGTDASDGLVAAYGFDEGSGSSVSDKSQTNDDGVISGATWSTQGKFGNALSFDGAGDIVTVADSASLDLSDGMTLEAWVKPASVGGDWQTVMMKEWGNDYFVYGLSTQETGKPVGLAYADDGLDMVEAPDPLAANTWTHLAVSYDGSALKAFMNGSQVASQAASGDITATGGALRIGGATVFPDEWFDGLIDEVRVYNRALSDTEIQTDKDTAISTIGEAPGVGEPTPTVTFGYSSTTGRPTTLTADGRTITTGYDNVGRVTSYTDADGNESETSYDLLSRPTSRNDGKGTQTYSYNATSGLLTGLEDSHAGSFTANYDPDGALQSKTYPNGLRADYSYDETGSATGLTYRKDSCTIDCVWFDEEIEESIHGQWRHRSFTDETQASEPPDGLVGAYGFDEGSGASVEDKSEAGNDGTISGASWSTQGKFGKALSFDGTNDRVAIPDSGSLDLDDEMTLEAWVKPATVGGDWQTVMMKEWDDFLVYGLSTQETGKPFGAAYIDDNLVTPEAPDALQADAWTHLALSYNGSNVKLFVNGTQAASQAATGPITATAGDLSIGGTTVFSDQWFDGLIDEVRIYDRALTNTEISTDKETPISTIGANHTDEVTYRYDAAGRLTGVDDDPADAGCTTRVYDYDKNSNRLTRTTRAPLSEGGCDTGPGGQVQSSSHDSADRLTSTGVVYDPFGRMTKVPTTHSGGGVLRTTYYLNDMVRSQTQDGAAKTWLLDPTLQRQRATVPVNGNQEVLHYSDDSDSPTWSAQFANGTPTSWTRNVEGIDGDLAAIHDSEAATTTLNLPNLHGDIIATTSLNSTATGPIETLAYDEFGNPDPSTGRRYGWLGSKQRRTPLPSGVIQMGVRSYVPAMGRFTSVDPVDGGSANAYDYAAQDPVNLVDLDGERPSGKPPRVVGIPNRGGFRGQGTGPKEAHLAVRRTVRGGGKPPRLHRIHYNLSSHAMGRMPTRGVDAGDIRRALRDGTAYWDVKTSNIAFVHKRGKKYDFVAYDYITGNITTVIRESTRFGGRNPKRFVKLGRQ